MSGRGKRADHPQFNNQSPPQLGEPETVAMSSAEHQRAVRAWAVLIADWLDRVDSEDATAVGMAGARAPPPRPPAGCPLGFGPRRLCSGRPTLAGKP
jgi:hypothetical protein